MAAKLSRPADFRLRFATADDAGVIYRALLGLGEHVGETHKIASTVEDIRNYGFGERPAFEVLIAEADGDFAGLCLFFPSFSTWIGRPGVYVQDLFVDEQFRGLGVGAKLLSRLAALTAGRGGCYIRLSVDTANGGAQQFYARLGLEHSKAEQIHAAYGATFKALAEADERYKNPEDR